MLAGNCSIQHQKVVNGMPFFCAYSNDYAYTAKGLPISHAVTYNFFNQPTEITDWDYQLNLIYGDNGVVAMYLVTRSGKDTITVHSDSVAYDFRDVVYTDSMYYIHTDHLGSYCAITNKLREVRQRNYFDPWGNPIDTCWQIHFALTYRGFTGHEHYPFLGIINMNGRLYDPVIGRFFSPDKYVANSSFTQDFNRYSYARNCPLHYTDPSGNHPILIAIAIGVAVAATSYTVTAAMAPGGLSQNWDLGQFALNTLCGGVLGGMSAGIGMALTPALAAAGIGGFWSGAITGAVTGTFTGTITGIMQYGTTGDANAIWRGALMGMGTGALIGGITSGFDAMRDGRTFWNGNISNEVTFAQSMNGAGKQGRGECLLYDLKSLSDSFSEEYTLNELSDLIVWAEDCSGANPELSLKNYAELTGKDYYTIKYPSQTDFCIAFMDDYRVVVNQFQFDEYNQMTIGHSVRPYIKVDATQITRPNGTVVYRNVSGYLYNPSSGVPESFKWVNIRSSRMFFLGN